MTTEVTSDTNNIVAMIGDQLDQYPTLINLIKIRSIASSSVFLPQTLRVIDHELSQNTELIYECISFLDMVNLCSFLCYGDRSLFVTNMIESIVYSRTVNKVDTVLAKDNMDDFLFTTREDLEGFIDSNKPVLAIYIYSLLYLFLYK